MKLRLVFTGLAFATTILAACQQAKVTDPPKPARPIVDGHSGAAGGSRAHDYSPRRPGGLLRIRLVLKGYWLFEDYFRR